MKFVLYHLKKTNQGLVPENEPAAWVTILDDEGKVAVNSYDSNLVSTLKEIFTHPIRVRTSLPNDLGLKALSYKVLEQGELDFYQEILYRLRIIGLSGKKEEK